MILTARTVGTEIIVGMMNHCSTGKACQMIPFAIEEGLINRRLFLPRLYGFEYNVVSGGNNGDELMIIMT